jgi:hypothetical protein
MVVISLALYFASYILVGWGVVLGHRFGALAIILGTTLYFVSLVAAIRSKLRPLVAVIAFLGLLLATIVLVVSVISSLDREFGYWFPTFVILILAVNCAVFASALKNTHSALLGDCAHEFSRNRQFFGWV